VLALATNGRVSVMLLTGGAVGIVIQTIALFAGRRYRRPRRRGGLAWPPTGASDMVLGHPGGSRVAD
jgi:hypothetical protein